MVHVVKFFMLLFILLTPGATWALSLDSSVIDLNCPLRGRIEIILHKYEHTQEFWGKEHFETGGGHSHLGRWLIFEFANLDKMVYDQNENAFRYWYDDNKKLVNCQLLNLKHTYPVNLFYFQE